MFEPCARRPFAALLALVLVATAHAGEEDCSGCADLDGDGLVGCYDPDCHVSPGPCDGSYLNQVLPATPDCASTLEIQYIWGTDSGSWRLPVLGDIDGDGDIEVVARGTSEDLRAYDGATGARGDWIGPNGPFGPLALGDVDVDGTAEIFTGGFNGGTIPGLRRVEHDFTEAWVTSPERGWGAESHTRGVSLADFDGDGLPEAYQQGAIRDAQTGTLLLDLSTEPLLGREGCVAADFFPDDACPPCAGLELASASGVWAVDVRAGLFELVGSLPSHRNGQLAVADWNGDEALDLIVNVTDRHVEGLPTFPYELFAWDPRTGEILGRHEYDFDWPSGVPLVSDFDGDAGLEIALLQGDPGVGFTVIRLWDDDFSVLRDLAVSSLSFDGSLTAFDFDRDGIADIVTRGDRGLQVVSALDGTILAETPCPMPATGPIDERPLVADLDGDGQAEILVGCLDGLAAWTVQGAPAARSVVNQYQDFNVQVNDDLTIPCQQQNHAHANLHPSLRGYLSAPGVYETIGTPCSEGDLCTLPEPAIVTEASGVVACPGGPTILTVSETTGCDGVALFRWFDEAGEVTCGWSSVPTCGVTGPEGATYTVELTCRGSCVTSTSEVVATANEPIVAEAGEDQMIPFEGTALLDGSASLFPGCPVRSYRWRDASGTLRDYSPEPTFLVTPEVDTEYFLDLRCADIDGCVTTDSVTVLVEPDPAFGASLRIQSATRTTTELEWPLTRPLEPDEHVHVYRASSPGGPFLLVAPLGDHASFRPTGWTDTEADEPLLFYDVRFADADEVVSESPWRPLP
ncbi:MAG: FG-GAP-like repeat-containing protein [Acidobacteriota bacterium]